MSSGTCWHCEADHDTGDCPTRKQWTVEHQPGSPGVDLDELDRVMSAYLEALSSAGARHSGPTLLATGAEVIAWFNQHGGEHAAILKISAELRTLRARVGELEATADRNANVIYADESVERYRKRIADLEVRAESAEARVKELEDEIRRALGIDAATGAASIESALNEVESYRRGMEQTELLRGLPLPKSLENAIRALAKLVPIHPSPDQLDSCDSVARRAAARITDLESQLAAAREAAEKLALELEKLSGAKPAYDLLSDLIPYLRRKLLDDITPAIGEPRDTSPMGLQLQSWLARVQAFEHGKPDPEMWKLRLELAAAREEQGLEAKVREVLGERFFQVRIARYHEFWQAEWREVVRGETLERFADAETLPALLRAILAVEKGGPDEG